MEPYLSNEFLQAMHNSRELQHFSGLPHLQLCDVDPAQPSLETLEGAVDNLIQQLAPSAENLAYRVERVVELATLLAQTFRTFGVKGQIDVHLFGSVHLKTVLPDGDNDVTLVVKGEAQSQDLLPRLREYLETHYGDYVFVDTLIFAEVRLLKLVYRGMSFDITVDQMGGAKTALFLHRVDDTLGKTHLFKRTLILLKAWCTYEARIVGGQGGHLGTYALSVMLIAVQSDVDESIQSPLALMLRFFEHYGAFDFETMCVTSAGPVPLYGNSKVTATKMQEALLSLAVELTALDLDGSQGKPQSIPSHFEPEIRSSPQSNASTPRAMETINEALGPSFPIRSLNVLDPMRSGSNLCRGICRAHQVRIQSAFREGALLVKNLMDSPTLTKESAYGELMSTMFSFTSEVLDPNPRTNAVAESGFSSAHPFCTKLDACLLPLQTVHSVV